MPLHHLMPKILSKRSLQVRVDVDSLEQIVQDSVRLLKENHLPHEWVHLSTSLAILPSERPKTERALSSAEKKSVQTPPPAPPSLPPAPQTPPPNKALATSPPTRALEIDPSAFKALAPHLFIDEPIPSDALAQKKRVAWKEKGRVAKVTLLSFDPQSAEHRFLQHLGAAISLRIQEATVVLASLFEKENRWNELLSSDALAHLIAFPLPLHSCPNLCSHYKEVPQTKERFVQNRPLFLLKPYASYVEDPMQKRELWNTLLRCLVSPPSS